jgi:RND family efflux transporter MFP subunit
MRRIAIAIVVALLSACDAAPGIERHEPPQPARVGTVLAAKKPLARSIEIGGVVQAAETATVASRITAQVRAVDVKAGDGVRAGDRLVLLDSRDLDADTRRAAARIAADEHAVLAARADGEAAQASLVLARAVHGRISELYARRSATAQELDEAVGALRAAEGSQAAAAARLAAATAALAVAREAAAMTGIAASFAAITAPFDGTVTAVLVDPGDLATPGTPLVRIEDARRIQVDVRVDEAQLPLLSLNQHVEVAGSPLARDERSQPPVPGRVVEISRDPSSGAHAFVATVAVPDEAGLRTGSFARVRVTGPPREGLAIPATAIVSRGQLPTVFVVSSGRARMRVIRAGISAGSDVEVLAGLAAGEEVIVDAPASLRDGDAVQGGAATSGARRD